MATRITAQTIFDRYRQDPSIKNKTLNWFQRQVNILQKDRIQPNVLVRGDKENRPTSRIVPGNLYMFFYDPKGKEELPYYDRFPLVFPYDASADGFIGLNMHYLPYQLRVRLLDRLLDYSSNRKMDNTTRLRYSWATIRSASKMALAKPCIKSYLTNHVQSSMLRVAPENWFTAMMLPVERFTKNKNNVWADSIGMI